MTSYPTAAIAPPTAPVRSPRLPLIAPRLRIFALCIIAAAGGFVAWLGVHVDNQQFLTSFDARVWIHALRHLGGHFTLARRVADIGGTPGLIVISSAVAGFMLYRRNYRGVVLAVAAPILATSLTEYVLKPWVHRAPFGANTFPSGHSTAAFSMAFVVAVLVLGPTTPVRNLPLRWLTAVIAVAVATAVAIALVVAGYHFATDTIGGAGVALAVVTIVALVIDLVANTWSRQRTASHV